MTLKIYKESLIWPNELSCRGIWLYGVAMSTIMAHFPVTLIFQRVYDKAATGLPTHLAIAQMVCQNSLLS